MSVELMRRDVHPAEVMLPGGALLRDCRAFVTSHRLICSAVEGGEIKRVLDLPLATPFSVEASRATLGHGRLDIELQDGTAFVNPGHGCGCGSPLKALGTPVPWTPS